MVEKIKNLDRRWIFLMIIIAVICPLLWPLGLGVKTSKPVESIYHYIEQLPEGSVLLLSFDYSPSTKIELGPAAEAIIRHAFKKNMKIVAIALWPDGALLSRKLFNDLAPEYNRQYGKDYVNLGYKAGGSVLLIGLKGGFIQSFPKDIDQKPLADLPLMNKVKDWSNIDLALSFSAGANGIKEYVMIVNTQFNVKVAGACTAVSAPEMYSYINSGQLLGIMGGLKGAAEYEMLMDSKGEARKGMDAQSVVHMLILCFILLSNAIYFIDEYNQKKAA